MNYRDLIHPSDAAALEKLKAVPGFDLATKWVMELGVEQYCKCMYMANHIRLSPSQLPKLYNLLPPICEKFGIDVPEFYLQMYPTPNAYTVGDKQVFIVITSGLLECLDGDAEVQSALAHECGHIACRHVFYSTMSQMILNFGGNVPVVNKLQIPLQLAYNYWCRQSELSADRASAAFVGSAKPVVTTLLRLAGGPPRYTAGMNVDEYERQIEESEQLQKDSKWQKFLRSYAVMNEDHPFTTTRIRELTNWCSSVQFSTLAKSLQLKGLGLACPRCGQEIESGQKFCRHCGAKIS